MGNRLEGHYYGYREAREKLPEKTPLGKIYDRNLGGNHGPNSEQLTAHPARLYS